VGQTDVPQLEELKGPDALGKEGRGHKKPWPVAKWVKMAIDQVTKSKVSITRRNKRGKGGLQSGICMDRC